MLTKKAVLSRTSYPRLVNAVVRRLGMDYVEDVNKHGIGGGFPGFTYYADTVSFFNSHKADILRMAEEMAGEFGQGMLEMIAGFQCLSYKGKPEYSTDEIARAIYQGKGESVDIIKNAMAWFAAEEVCRMFEE